MRNSKTARSEAARLMGRQSYRVRLERLGLARLQEIARENGKKGGRPKGSGKNAAVDGGGGEA